MDAIALRSVMVGPRVCALVQFEGWARDHQKGRPVLELAYEAYVPMAVKELWLPRHPSPHRRGTFR